MKYLIPGDYEIITGGQISGKSQSIDNWQDSKSASWQVDGVSISADNLDLQKLITEKPKYSLKIDHRVFVRGKQYARPFTYIKTTDLGVGELTEYVKSNDGNYSFTATFEGLPIAE